MTISKKIAGLLVLSLVLVCFCVNPLLAANGKTVIAEVNGAKVYKEEFDKQFDMFVRQITAQANTQPTAEELQEMRKVVLDDLIEYKMLLAESAKQGIKVDKSEIDAEINNLKQNFVNENGFAAALKQANMTEAEFTDRIKDGIAIQKLIEKQVADQVRVTDAETKAFYDANPAFFEQDERVHARHILIRVEPNASAIEKDKAKKKLEEVLLALKNGGDFADLAIKYSEDPSKVMGGDLGYFTKGRMVKPFEEAAFKLKPGEVSGIIETQFGYHLIKVEDHQQPRTIPYEEIKDLIADNLTMQKKQEAAGKYIESLYQKAKITRQGA